MSTETDLLDEGTYQQVSTDVDPPSVRAPLYSKGQKESVYGVQATGLDTRTATISRSATGKPLPIVLIVNPDELRTIGIDPVEVDAVEYAFANDALLLRHPD